MTADATAEKKPDLVNLEIDGHSVAVAKGTTIIQAAEKLALSIPYYCYHQNLSIAGNCRMCQVEVEGAPKLMIACHTQVTEGMKVKTQLTSPAVKKAQEATLEFILINHPLDCTVCDQAGHCKLQDYHYDYNAKPSRFLEEKVHKIKAEPLGPNVILDGERCIMCTRCIRFCDEITGTSELGMVNRGDRSMITVHPGKDLDNALSGSVVDLCPVGALTHRKWRFNTRIWYTKQTDTICPGCSTGCNVKVAVRDQQIVQVKARHNEQVNKEWLCDEGRYGFERFLPESRVLQPTLKGAECNWDVIVNQVKKIKDVNPIILIAPDLYLEEYFVIKDFLDRVIKKYQVAVAYKERNLNDVEKILVSPDYAANFRGAEFAGLIDGSFSARYNELVSRVRGAGAQGVLLIGDRAIDSRDVDAQLLAGLKQTETTIGVVTDAAADLSKALQLLIPGRSVLEKSGLLVNRQQRLQYAERIVDFPASTEPEWRIIAKISDKLGTKLSSAQSDRDLTLETLAKDARLKDLKIKQIKAGGVDLLAARESEPVATPQGVTA